RRAHGNAFRTGPRPRNCLGVRIRLLGVIFMKARIQLRSSTRGVVSIEMLLAFFPVLVTFLGVIQLALLFMGKLVVAHAAQRAVRSAVVILDDDPEYYDDSPRGDLESGAIPVEGSFAEF